MTFAGALIIVAVCAYVGDALARQKRRELLQAEGFAALLGHILRRLPTLQLMGDILADFHDATLEKLGVTAHFCGSPCNKSFAAAIELVKEDEPLYKALARVSAELGSTDMESQRQIIASAEAEIQILVQKRREGLPDTERCYRRLGLLGGAAVAILLL